MHLTSTLDIAIAALIVVRVVYRNTVARPVTIRQIWALPAVLAVVGILSITRADHNGISSTAAAYIAVDIATSIALGCVRGALVHIYANDGVMWRKGGKVSLGLWLVSIAVRAAIAVLATRAGVGTISDAFLPLSFGLSLLAQSGVVAWRGNRRKLPFAPAGAHQ